MTLSTMPSAGELLGLTLLFVLVMLALSTAVGTFWLWRRWRRLRALALRHARELTVDAGGRAGYWAMSLSLPDRRWRSVHRTRRRLARAVVAAQGAVRVARSDGAPVGELESIAGRLSGSATRCDRLLRVAQRDPGAHSDLGALTAEAEGLLVAARRIQHTATMASWGTGAMAQNDLHSELERESSAILEAIADTHQKLVVAPGASPIGPALHTTPH